MIIMKVAVAYEGGRVFRHFGHTAMFKMYEVEGGKILSSEVVSTNGSGHGALATFLKEQNVNAVICGGIGGGAKNALGEAGIEIYGGVRGLADESVKALLAGTLNYTSDATCDHHDHEHEEGHTCGEHGCGEHGCH